MTSKSLKRARHKAALKQKEAEAAAAPMGVTRARRDWSRVVSEALVAGKWQAALEGLVAMRGSGQIPKLGSVQRWVRLADLSGDEQLAARLLDAIMRTAAAPTGGLRAVESPTDVSSGPKHDLRPQSAAPGTTAGPLQTAAEARDPAAAEMGSSGATGRIGDPAAADSKQPCGGSMRRHPAWVPPAPPGDQRFIGHGGSDTVAQSGSAAEEGLGAVAEAAEAAVKRCVGHVHVVGHDQGGAQVGALANSIFMTDPGVIEFDQRTVVRVAHSEDGPPAAGEAPAVAEPEPELLEPSASASRGDLSIAGCRFPGGHEVGVVRRVEVPFVPGAFVLTGVLSRSEAAQIVAVSERMGYSQDADYTFSAPETGSGSPAGNNAGRQTRLPAELSLEPGPDNNDHGAETGAGGTRSEGGDGPLSAARASAGGERAAGCVWLADDSLLSPLWERVRGLLPRRIAGCALMGINARWRLYRYDQGTVYRPHVDGAWPGSGFSEGKVLFDAFGDRWSRLTFLLYLNDGFEGGATTFYTPGEQEGVLEARGVSPRCGNVLVFPHGDTAGSLVHEGSAVTRGIKYVVRSDVLYETKRSLPRRSKADEERGGVSSGQRVKKKKIRR